MHHDNRLAPFGAVTLLLGALLVLNAAITAEAQSGRRIPKRPATSDPTPPKESEPPIVKPEETQSTKPAVPITIAKHLYDVVYSSDIYLNAVMSGFMERMEKVRSVKAQPAPRHMNRKEASDAAKGSQDRYVVWYQLMAEGGTSTYNSPASSLYVDFVVFLPATGKSKTSGHIYQRTRSVGGVGVPTPGRMPAEYALYQAGMELADRVLSTLDLDSPATTPPTR